MNVVQPNAANPLLSLLVSIHSSHHVKQAHGHLLKLQASLLLYNTLLRALSSTRLQPQRSLSLLRSMLYHGPHPNHFTYPSLLKASDIRCGSLVHSHVVQTGHEGDPYVQSTLIHMYADHKELHAARRVLDGCSAEQTVCWNSMIDGYVKHGGLEIARSLFDRMGCRDVISWNTMINGYSLLGELSRARELFDQMPVRNVVSWNSMLAGYVKCGDVDGAREIFLEMPWRDVVSWNTMLACYAQSGRPNDALGLFEEMKRSNVKPSEATMVSLLSACAHLGVLDLGESLHAYVNDNNIEINGILATALTDMYAKCGSIKKAMKIFYGIEHKDVLAWNTIISGMALHGEVGEALRLFNEMTESGIAPNDITFVAVLSACSHAGMVREGRQLLDNMKEMYGIDPKVEHYGCVLDLLARAGLLEDAMKLAKAMPVEPNAPAWGALLGGCRIHENTEVAEGVGERLLSLQPKHSGRYVLLANVYATANRWEDAKKVRSMMVSNGVAKVPGLSVIELKGVVNQFFAGDQAHPETDRIYRKLVEIMERLKIEAGYLPDTKQVLLDIEEEEKDYVLSVHSEKLAIAFGLLHTSSGDTIRVVKNLRVCKDCHNVTKLISRVYGREIVMRDRNRFHHFRDGACSCMDYW